MDAEELILVCTTVSNLQDVRILARAALDQNLAACVQIEAIQSIYKWKGEVQSEPEQRMMFKTTRSRYQQLESMLVEMHPYELPVIFAVPVVAATAACADWVRDAVA
jgi:periplasmic divalent cation tolerance protein